MHVILLEKIESNGVSIPAYLTRTPENIQAMNSTIHYGDIVMLEGVKLRADDSDVFLGERIELLSKAVEDVYYSNIDFRKKANLYTHRHLQLIRDPDRLSHFRRCSLVLHTIRQFLYQRGYEEVSMTLLQKSFEAGLADPFITHATESDKDMFLRVTSELLLWKLMIAGFSKIFEIGKSFRNQGATADMLPQFTILELYHAYADREEMENLMRDMIREILVQLYGSATLPTSEGVIDCSGEWTVYNFKDEVEKCTGMSYDEKCSIEKLLSMMDKMGIPRPAVVNKYTIATAMYFFVMSKIKGPAFLRNLPASQSPLYKLNDDKSTVDETLLVINGMLVADIVNPERDPEIVKRRMEEQLRYRKGSQTNNINEDILNAMRFGLPPSRGVGMGIERLLMLLLNVEDVRDVELFPVF
jgi:lysyl-tRNA synthetase class 2